MFQTRQLTEARPSTDHPPYSRAQKEWFWMGLSIDSTRTGRLEGYARPSMEK